VRKLGNLLTSIKDPVNVKFGQGVVYCIPCGDYNKRFIRETKRSIETHQKELKAHVKDKGFNKSALTQNTFNLE